jgi:hypothetical protein
MMTTIDWKEVKRIMIDRNIDSFAHLSRLTGIHKNSMGRGGAFKLIKVEGLKEE